MLRRDFLQLCAVLGLAAPLASCGLLSGDEELAGVEETEGAFDGKVLIIGAGAAGMSAGHLLRQRGIDFTILEAAPTYGGRIKTATDFVDFPIPLGGEWVHVAADVLDRIVDDSSVQIGTTTVAYTSEATAASWRDGVLTTGPLEDSDLKFVGDTWLTFFEQYVLPSVEDRLIFDTQVLSIDYFGAEIVLTDASNTEHVADAVIVTLPPKVIQDHAVSFTPPLPDDKREAFDEAYIWGGMKVFIEFTEAFYPTALEIHGTNNDRGQKLFYDAAYGQLTSTNVLGLFTVGDQSIPYQQLSSGDEVRDFILAELDEIFDGVATPAYLQHISQNWNDEPFIGQAYFADSADWRLPPRMRSPIDDRVFFAGASYTDGSDWGSVHTAALSARDAVGRLAQR
ncbi:MAG: monoamine oxidase [Candidatus Poriferisodalaceae bacterium]